jgi:hypothetical protein
MHNMKAIGVQLATGSLMIVKEKWPHKINVPWCLLEGIWYWCIGSDFIGSIFV